MSIDSVANMNGRDVPKTPGNRMFLRPMCDFPLRVLRAFAVNFYFGFTEQAGESQIRVTAKTRRTRRETAVQTRGRRRALTLVELLVAIGIVAVLAIVIARVAIHLRRSAQTTSQRANFAAIESALTAYYQDFGDYPRNSILPKWNTRQDGAGAAPTPAPLFYSLATALLGPGPAVTQTVRGELQMGDGNDGPGFRSQSVTVFTGKAAADAGKAIVKVSVDAQDIAAAAQFANDFAKQGNDRARRASITFSPSAGQPFGESIGIAGVTRSGDQFLATLMVAPAYSHNGRCQISVADGKVWGPYLSPMAARVAFVPSVDSYGYAFFGYGQPVLLDDWGQVIQYFPRYGPAGNRTDDSTYPADPSVKAGPLYGNSQPKSVDVQSGQNAIWDWRDGAPFFTLVGQTGPAQQWPDPALGTARSFRPELAIQWMLGEEPDSSGDFRNQIAEGERLNYDGPYILISAGPDGPERPDGGYCNFADPQNGNKPFPKNILEQLFLKSGNIYNFERR
jgi:type II secretory pathway pseudopilin PulG